MTGQVIAIPRTSWVGGNPYATMFLASRSLRRKKAQLQAIARGDHMPRKYMMAPEAAVQALPPEAPKTAPPLTTKPPKPPRMPSPHKAPGVAGTIKWRKAFQASRRVQLGLDRRRQVYWLEGFTPDLSNARPSGWYTAVIRGALKNIAATEGLLELRVANKHRDAAKFVDAANEYFQKYGVQFVAQRWVADPAARDASVFFIRAVVPPHTSTRYLWVERDHWLPEPSHTKAHLHYMWEPEIEGSDHVDSNPTQQ